MTDPVLKENLQKTVSSLRKGDVAAAATGIPQIVAGLKSLTAGKEDAQVKDLALAVRAIVSSFEHRDYVLMADFIEFEILPFLNEQDRNGK
ncbi:MAG: hypothetical protein JXD21_02455 [Candidatus Omnitrophica bacterium]|nr:hypothetical protein [Candidatus Omnitrophota bacterium]